ncbi:TVP38/TMEM64 family protein [Gymnodinialimonas ceratoperidinii]|nr:TVP38/TMEM64 family protein [Gymnodinialimonas ceratoperidinii]
MIQTVQIKRLFSVILALGVIATLVVFWDQMNSFLNGIDPERVRAIVAFAGSLGPLVIIGLMTLAIVASPVPSAPIAMAAGLVYGHLWGTVLVVIGAELGAIVAFVIARYLGRDTVQRWLGDSMKNRFFGSQNALMATVFLSRLLPFISFDAISYAAGLSHIKFWRFGLATLAGIVPASFVLAHLGASAFEGQGNAGFWISLALGASGLLTVAIWRNRITSTSDAAPVVSGRKTK